VAAFTPLPPRFQVHLPGHNHNGHGHPESDGGCRKKWHLEMNFDKILQNFAQKLVDADRASVRSIITNDYFYNQ